jgi:polyphosphate kinase
LVLEFILKILEFKLGFILQVIKKPTFEASAFLVIVPSKLTRLVELEFTLIGSLKSITEVLILSEV